MSKTAKIIIFLCFVVKENEKSEKFEKILEDLPSKNEKLQEKHEKLVCLKP